MTTKTKMKLKLTHRKTFNVERYQPGSYDSRGDWIPGSLSTIQVKGNEQPLPGYELQHLPDSFRSKDVRKFFSLTFLNSVEEASGQEPDKIIIDGVKFEVQKRKSYQMGVRDHYEYTISRVEQSAGETS